MNKRKWGKLSKRLSGFSLNSGLLKYAGNRWYSFKNRQAGGTLQGYPSSILLELTNHCNLRCGICPRESEPGHEMNQGFMEFGLFKSIIDECYPYLDSVGLTGLGETFLYKKIVEAVDYIHEKNKGIVTFISTNAHVKSIPAKLEQLAGRIDTVQVSIDGTGDVYDQIRSKGDFGTFKGILSECAEVLKGSSTDLMLNMVIVPENAETINAVLDLAHELGIGYLHLNTVNWVANPERCQDYEFFQTFEFKELWHMAFVKAERLGIYLTGFDFHTPPQFQKCSLAWNQLYVTWDGYLAVCCAKPFPKLKHFGNVNKQSLIDCINSPEFREFRGQWLKNETPAYCSGCHMVSLTEWVK